MFRLAVEKRRGGGFDKAKQEVTPDEVWKVGSRQAHAAKPRQNTGV